ncbi:hypothetical protein P280DRAFT_467214 [Massarina eburnea CBS 473.64]|uniref:Uncharacterized protein n=1 Tax=Massarina eburnea CBS 473.64 TaxID=1395130 RepID=A0A6A6S9L6_9PLEO|nr:hypothetical protein P280DRAFT_467214 [Massarina eburnea CBS 473.64]
MPDQIKEGFEKTKDVLQELVVVVSLVRTLTDSFGSASELYRKLKKKSKHVKEDIKGHIEGDEDHHHRKYGRSRSKGRASSEDERSRSRGKKGRYDSHDSDAESIDTSSPLVRAEYDYGYRFIGERYAVGDLITRNQLQTQIIALQQTLLWTYEDVLGHPRHPPDFYLQRLHLTTRAARAASIDALASQYKRMRLPPDDPEMHILPAPPGAFPSSTPDQIREHEPGKPSRHLFCIYAHNLQKTPSLPLNDRFQKGGNNKCPFCDFHIPVLPTKAWEIIKQDDKEPDTDRVFLVGTRFLVKSHREGGGYACVLCRKYRDADTRCKEVQTLVDHLWKDHACAGLAGDEDIKEVPSRR